MISKEFSVEASPDIAIHIQSGRVTIRGGPAGKVKVDAETDDPRFVVEQRGGQVYVSTDKNSGWSSRGSAYVTLHAPEESDVTITTASAQIEIDASIRDLNVKTASGDIDVTTTRNATIKTASGDARVGEVTADIKISSASGDVNLGQSMGKVNFSSASGDLLVGEGSGPLNASTASGDVAVHRFSGRQANVKTMSGEVEIGIPAGTRLDLDVTLMSGELHTPKPTNSSQAVERQMSIKARMASGDLWIRRV